MRIAIVEDNKTLAQAIALLLQDQGHSTDVIHDGNDAIEFLVRESADVVVLDINLPSQSGLAILSQMRRSGDQTPVILLTARGDTKDRVAGLNAGADDYLVKPFEMEELDARIRALLRRKSATIEEHMQTGPVQFDRTSRQVLVSGAVFSLPRREIATFECLFDRQGQLVSKSSLADHLYGVGADVEEKVVEVYISRLRKRLSPFGAQIKTARGLGYMMILPK